MQVNFPGDLIDDPRIDFAAAELECEPDLVIGKLVRVIRGALQKRSQMLPSRWIDGYAKCEGFAAVLVSVGLASHEGDQVRLDDEVVAKQLSWLGDQDAKRQKALAAKRAKAGIPGDVPGGVPGKVPIESVTGTGTGTGTGIGTGTGGETKSRAAASGTMALSTPPKSPDYEKAKQSLTKWTKDVNPGTRVRWTPQQEATLAEVLRDVPWSTLQWQAIAYFENCYLPEHYGPPYNLAGFLRAIDRGDLSEAGESREYAWKHEQERKEKEKLEKGAA